MLLIKKFIIIIIMVCIVCIVIPALLWIFHKYLQPIILKFWNPWASKSVSAPTDAGGDATLETVSSHVIFYKTNFVSVIIHF